MPKVLVICRANIFRSPLAVGLLKEELAAEPQADGWEFVSAGTWANGGIRPDRRVRNELTRRGIGTLGKRSREVNREMVEEADLVLTMTGNQQEALQVEFPDQAEKVQMFSELGGEVKDIPDPAGKSESVYREVLEMIEGYVKDAGEKLRRMVREGE